MNILFCDESYPGRFGSIPLDMAADPANRVMFLSFHAKGEAVPAPIIHARLNLARDRERLPRKERPDLFVAEWEKMFGLGRQAMQTFVRIREAGFVPEMIFVAFFDGTAFFLRHVFPQAFMVSLFRGFRSKTPEDDVRFEAVLDMQKMMLTQSNLYFVRSEGQKNLFSPKLRNLVHVWPAFVDTEFYRPQPPELHRFFPHMAEGEKRELVTIHMKGKASLAEAMLPVMAAVLAQRPQCLAALTFGSDLKKERWEKLCHCFPENVRRRIFLGGALGAEQYRSLLCSSTVHVFPENTSPPLQEMLESMSCGSILMMPLADNADEFFADGETMIAFPEQHNEAQIRKICDALERKDRLDGLRKNAREKIEEYCSYKRSIAEPLTFIMDEFRKRSCFS